MAKRITINIGFITNSSSCVYYFPPEVLQDPDVKAFMEANELTSGYIGSDLWHRSECDSLLLTPEQKATAKRKLWSYDEDSSEEPSEASEAVNPEAPGAYIIYGDEYQDVTHVLCSLMKKAYSRIMGKEDSYSLGYLTDFN